MTQSCRTLSDFMKCSTPGFLVPQHLPKFAQAHVNCIGDAIHPTHPLTLLLPSVFSRIRDFSSESSVLIRWPEYWNFSLRINPFSEYSRVISLKFDWFDFLDVQGTFSSLLQHHSLKASILWCSAFFMVQLTTVHDHWENHSLDYTDLCRQSNVCFSTHCLGLS